MIKQSKTRYEVLIGDLRGSHKIKERLNRFRLHVAHMIVNVLLLSSACDVAAAQGGTLWKAAAQLGEPPRLAAASRPHRLGSGLSSPGLRLLVPVEYSVQRHRCVQQRNWFMVAIQSQ